MGFSNDFGKENYSSLLIIATQIFIYVAFAPSKISLAYHRYKHVVYVCIHGDHVHKHYL